MITDPFKREFSSPPGATSGTGMSDESSLVGTTPEPGQGQKQSPIPPFELDRLVEDRAGFGSPVDEFKSGNAVRQAQKMETIAQLAGGVAHDFNNIFAAMILRLEILQLQPESPTETQSSLHELESLAKRGASLTRRLLLFGQQLVMHPEEVEINVAFTNFLRMLRPLLGENIICLHLASTKELWVKVDSALLDQAIMSLCLNSRDAMPNGGTLTLEISQAEFNIENFQAHAESRPGHFVCLRISDTGCGMNADIVSHLFEPFFTTKEAGKGPGLGLTSVYGIVHQHKGWMNVVSAEGKGTTFRLYLPALQKTKLAHATIRPSSPSSSCQNETILLVDDEIAVQSVCAAALTLFGYNVLLASDGEEAMQHWEKHRDTIDLVLTDMIMPGISGLDLAKELWKAKPTLKIIIMSGYGLETVWDDIAGNAGYTFLLKPFNLKTLGQTLRQCLDQAK